MSSKRHALRGSKKFVALSSRQRRRRVQQIISGLKESDKQFKVLGEKRKGNTLNSSLNQTSFQSYQSSSIDIDACSSNTDITTSSFCESGLQELTPLQPTYFKEHHEYSDSSCSSGNEYECNATGGNSFYSLDERCCTLSQEGIGETDESDAQNIDTDHALQAGLVELAVTHNIPRTTVTELLKVLRKHPILSFLPSDFRSLLKTPRLVKTVVMKPGKYYHFGLVSGIRRVLATAVITWPDKLEVMINADGAPLAKSSNSQIWPILGMIRNIKPANVVFPIGIYHGYKKPSDSNDFVRYFVEEASQIEASGGLMIDSRIILIKFIFVFDAPALSYILKTKGHGGKYGCNKCTTKGKWVRNVGSKGGRTTFPDTDAALRTNSDFRDRSQIEHHLGRSILEDLKTIKMVEHFPVDPMHLFDLGIMRKLLVIWTTGRHFCHRKLSSDKKAELDKRISALRQFIPSDFARKPRDNPLSEIERWKATELNQFACYTGPIVLTGILEESVMNHFLLFHVGVRLMSNERICRDSDVLNYASSMFTTFVHQSVHVYGPQFISFNVHNLIHVPNDVSKFGNTHSFAAYPFENFNQKLKNRIQKSPKPLSQLVKRLVESQVNSLLSSKNTNQSLNERREYVLIKQHDAGPLIKGIRGKQYKFAEFRGWKFGIHRPDNCAIMRDGSILVIKNFLEKNGSSQPMCLGYQYTSSDNFFNFPLHSSLVDSYKVSSHSEICAFPLESIQSKAVRIKYESDNEAEGRAAVYIVSALINEHK